MENSTSNNLKVNRLASAIFQYVILTQFIGGNYLQAYIFVTQKLFSRVHEWLVLSKSFFLEIFLDV
jgi:hypothetical protein